MAFRTTTQAVDEVKGRTKPPGRATGGDPARPKKVHALKVMSSLAGGLLPDQIYIQDGLRNGTITKQSVGMKSIVVDTSFQARVPQDNGKHFNMEHVRKLAAIRDADDSKPLAPIVLFLDRKSRKYYIADGFHRHEENRLRKCADISAYVVDVEDWKHEATLFAAMCNQEMCLPRRPEDIRKAAYLLFADPICWEWSNRMVADHCGCSLTSVNRYRIAYAEENQLDLPQRIRMSDGKTYSRTNIRVTGKPTVSPRRGRKSGFVGVYKEKQYFGRTPEEVAAKIATASEETEPVRLRLRDHAGFRYWLARREILGETINLNLGPRHKSSCIRVASMLLVVLETVAAKEVFEAAGSLLFFRHHAGMPSVGLRLVVVCYHDEIPNELIDGFCHYGIEFLTPDELVASLKVE